MLPESQPPSVLVMVCGMASLLVQVTAWPGAIVRLGGLKAKPAMVMAGPPAPADEVAPRAVGLPAARVAVAPGATAGRGALPGCTTSLRGALPTGMVASSCAASTS